MKEKLKKIFQLLCIKRTKHPGMYLSKETNMDRGACWATVHVVKKSWT